jgi:hypothetical protein
MFATYYMLSTAHPNDWPFKCRIAEWLEFNFLSAETLAELVS